MNTQITLLSDDALDAVSGGKANNGQGEVFQYGVGALVRTGDVGTGNHGVDIISGLGAIGFLALGALGFANASNSPLN